MEIEAHGGSCCGITHVYGFNNPDRKLERYENGYGKTTLEYFKEQLKNFLDYQYDENQEDGYETVNVCDGWDYRIEKTDKKFSCILEATLTDHQMKEWAPHLKEAGFKVVNRFLNSNSGNVVNVLHYNPAGRREIPEAPYTW